MEKELAFDLFSGVGDENEILELSYATYAEELQLQEILKESKIASESTKSEPSTSSSSSSSPLPSPTSTTEAISSPSSEPSLEEFERAFNFKTEKELKDAVSEVIKKSECPVCHRLSCTECIIPQGSVLNCYEKQWIDWDELRRGHPQSSGLSCNEQQRINRDEKEREHFMARKPRWRSMIQHLWSIFSRWRKSTRHSLSKCNERRMGDIAQTSSSEFHAKMSSRGEDVLIAGTGNTQDPKGKGIAIDDDWLLVSKRKPKRKGGKSGTKRWGFEHPNPLKGTKRWGFDHEIVWPPMVVIMNTMTSFFKDGKCIGMGSQELLEHFSSYPALKAQHSYGPQGHCGLSVMIFESSAIGYLEAESLHRNFVEQGSDRFAWNSCPDLVLPGGEPQLYGFMAVKEDLDIFNQHCQGKSKIKYELKSYREAVLNEIRKMIEDSQQLIWLKDRLKEERKHEKTFEGSVNILSRNLQQKMKDIHIFEQRVQLLYEQSKEEMDSQESFYKDQIKILEAKVKELEKLQESDANPLHKVEPAPAVACHMEEYTPYQTTANSVLMRIEEWKAPVQIQ